MNKSVRLTVVGIAGVWAGWLLPGAHPASASDRLLAVGWNDSRRTTGMIGAIGVDNPWSHISEPLEVGRDPLLRFAFGKLYVTNSDNNAIRIVDPERWTIDRTLTPDLNGVPVDIAVASPTTAYLTLNNSAHVLRLDLASGQATHALDLSILAEPGAIPELGTMILHEDRLFVQVRRLDREDALSRAGLAVMDLATGQLIDADPDRPGVQAIELAGTAPKGKMQILPNDHRLWVNATGGFFDAGGIEAVDTVALRSEGLVIREADGLTGADINTFVMIDARQGYLTYSTDLLASSHLHHFTASGDVDPTELHVALDYLSRAIAFDGPTNALFVPSGGFDDSGIHVFDAATGRRLTDRVVPTTSGPTDLVLIPEPGGMLLIALATLGFAGRRTGRRSS